MKLPVRLAWVLLLVAAAAGVGYLVHPGDGAWLLAGAGLFGRFRSRKRSGEAALVQERAGFHLGINPEIMATAQHAAQLLADKYREWLDGSERRRGSRFRRDYFAIAVGGGNTVKFEYRALLKQHARDIDWLAHVRFFLLEESCNEPEWESSRDALVSAFIAPLAAELIGRNGGREIAERLGLPPRASQEDIVQRMQGLMVFAIDMSGVAEAIARGERALALKRAEREARRYEALVRERLGPAMSFHMIISGIAKDGGIGAFAPYTPELRQKTPKVLVLDKGNGAVSVAMGRGMLTAADCISLIISGSLKLKALGRFEMAESVDFEQTVMETPLRMLRETREIAGKVYIFADDRALHFPEASFEFEENGETVRLKSEVREGEEDGGVHVLLVHGFMGLYSYINLLIRLPSAWMVSALRRGSYAKRLADEEIFPHYANALREVVLRNWRSGRPSPVCCHSMAGTISDHLMLSVLGAHRDELPAFRRLAPEDQELIEALRAGGVVHIATWTPSDINHISRNFAVRKASRNGSEPVDYSGPDRIYERDDGGALVLNSEHREGLRATPAAVQRIIDFRGTETLVNALNAAIRSLAGTARMRRLVGQEDAPYGQRLLAGRVLGKVSFYGVLKEVSAAMHDPGEYQARHLRALDAIVAYDIPLLVVIHRDDFMVSANRHREEHEYLVAARLRREGVRREEDLAVPVRLVLLERETEEASADPIDAHFLILSRSHHGADDARRVTAAITRFVNENAARAIAAGKVRPLASVAKWCRENGARVRRARSR